MMFGIGPTARRPLSNEILDAIMDAFAAHEAMSKQALDSEAVRAGLKDILLGPGRLWELLRDGGKDV
jgi:type I restriction enzyme R subunit